MDKLEKFVDTIFFPIAQLTIIIILICLVVIAVAITFFMFAML